MSIFDEVDKLLQTLTPVPGDTECPICGNEAVMMYNAAGRIGNQVIWCCEGHVVVIGDGFESITLLIPEGR